MAEYELPDAVEKRVRFFDGQFLQDQDFVDEQNYHLDRERRHNRLLHVAGIVEGLGVAAGAAYTVKVGAGTAVDTAGRQLVLAAQTEIGLPTEFSDQHDVELYLTYRESETDLQPDRGSKAYTRWLEQPELGVARAGESYSGPPRVLLAKLALDHQGAVEVDDSVRHYSGVSLPGPEEPPTMRTGADGRVSIDAPLDVTGAGGKNVDLVVNGRLRSSHTDGGLWVGDDDHRFVGGWGYVKSDVDVNLIGFFNDGWRLVVTDDGKVGIGTHEPKNMLGVNGSMNVAGRVGIDVDEPERALDVNGDVGVSDDLGVGRDLHVTGRLGVGAADPEAKLEVKGDGGEAVDLLVNGRLRSSDTQGGLLVGPAGAKIGRFVGGYSTDKVGFWLNNNWRLTVNKDGNVGIGIGPDEPQHRLHVRGDVTVLESNVGIGTATPKAKLEVEGYGGKVVDLLVNGRMRSGSPDGGLWVGVAGQETDENGDVVRDYRFVGGWDTTKKDDDGKDVPNRLIGFFNDGWRLVVDDVGNVGIGTAEPKNELGVLGNMNVEGRVGICVDEPTQALEVEGETFLRGRLFVKGDVVMFWDGKWRQIQNTWNIGLAFNDDYRGTTPSVSDIRLKTFVRPIGDALEAVLGLQGTRYRWGEAGIEYFTKDIPNTLHAGPDATDEDNRRLWDTERARVAEALAGDRIGLIAQDVETVAPELVTEDRDGYKHIAYGHLSALLVEAIKEQHAEVQALSGRIAALEAVQ